MEGPGLGAGPFELSAGPLHLGAGVEQGGGEIVSSAAFSRGQVCPMFPLPSHSRPEIGEAGGAFSGEGFGGAQGSAEGGHLLTTPRSTTGRQGKARGGRRRGPYSGSESRPELRAPSTQRRRSEGSQSAGNSQFRRFLAFSRRAMFPHVSPSPARSGRWQEHPHQLSAAQLGSQVYPWPLFTWPCEVGASSRPTSSGSRGRGLRGARIPTTSRGRRTRPKRGRRALPIPVWYGV